MKTNEEIQSMDLTTKLLIGIHSKIIYDGLTVGFSDVVKHVGRRFVHTL